MSNPAVASALLWLAHCGCAQEESPWTWLYGVILSTYLWEINLCNYNTYTCRVSQRSQKCHRVRTKVRTPSKINIHFRCRFKRVTRAYNTFLYYITSFLRRLPRHKVWVNGRQPCIGFSNQLSLWFVITLDSLISYPSPQFPTSRTLPWHETV